MSLTAYTTTRVAQHRTLHSSQMGARNSYGLESCWTEEWDSKGEINREESRGTVVVDKAFLQPSRNVARIVNLSSQGEASMTVARLRSFEGNVPDGSWQCNNSFRQATGSEEALD